ncbi:MAG: hypothetical protein BWY80_00652 [Firmicutes bacterium ADurb.Bin456]|nr:MAG: hypothetical protein BWY80_00652 [Firmicutes bacterium ADurb.Bin456]
MGELGQKLPRLLDNLTDIPDFFLKLAANHGLFFYRKLNPFHQVIHIITVALLGWNASGGSMGLLNIPLFFQVRHLIPDGGRTHPELVFLSNGPGTNRFGCSNEVLDYSHKHFLLAVIHSHTGPPSLVVSTLSR